MMFFLCAGVTFLGFLATFFITNTRGALRLLQIVTVSSLLALGFGFYLAPEPNQVYYFSNYFVSDATSRLFLIFINVVLLGFAPYVINRVHTNELAARKMNLYVRLTLLFITLCIFVIFSNHLVLMWMALEGTTLAAVPLIYHQRGKDSIRAAWKYFIFSTVGLSLTFFGLVLLAEGNHEITFFINELGRFEFHKSIWTDLAIFFCILGLGTKLGLAPMYTWLPDTYDNAPPSVTGLLAAIQFNCAILMLFRLVPIFRNIDASFVSSLLIGIGLLSILVATVNIVITKNYKRLISYASINHAGIIALGLGTGKAANYGVILYVLSNSLVKAILFFTAGNIKARFQTKNMADLQGLIKDMPYSGWFFMIGIFALLGFAPFGSFLGEVMIISSIMEAGNYLIFFMLCLLIVITFVGTGRSVFPMIWGTPKLELHQRGESIFALLPNLIYLGLLFSLGVYIPETANNVLIQVADMLGGR